MKKYFKAMVLLVGVPAFLSAGGEARTPLQGRFKALQPLDDPAHRVSWGCTNPVAAAQGTQLIQGHILCPCTSVVPAQPSYLIHLTGQGRKSNVLSGGEKQQSCARAVSAPGSFTKTQARQ